MVIDPAAFFLRPMLPSDIPIWERETVFAELSEDQREELAAALLEAKGESGWDQIAEACHLLIEAEIKTQELEGLLAEARVKQAEAEKVLVEASTPVLGFTTEEVLKSSDNRDRWTDAVCDIFI